MVAVILRATLGLVEHLFALATLPLHSVRDVPDLGQREGRPLTRVRWSDEVDGILAGDLTAALAYVTPAGGAVVTAVAPVGLRDRSAGTVGFSTSLGLGRKLERIRQNPRIALAYHSRENGFSRSPRLVLARRDFASPCCDSQPA